MSGGSLARRYAKALFQLAEEAGNLERVGAELRSIAQVYQDSEMLASTLSNPVFPASDRRRVLEGLLGRIGASSALKNFVFLLFERGRVEHLVAISRELDGMIDERVGRTAAEVISAAELSPSEQQQIKSKLESVSGKTVELKASVDSDLLGGVVARVGDLVYDGSLRTQLQKIRDSLAG